MSGAGRTTALLACGALLLAGCGKKTETREADLQAGTPTVPSKARAPAAPRTPRGQPTPTSRARIAVVTHGQASDPFWAIVRSGVDQASRQVGATTTYTAPDTADPRRMRQLILQAIAAKPDGLVVSIPDVKAVGGAIRAAVRAGIPVVSINSGAAESARLGALAHIGQDDERSGFVAGQRMAAEGVREAVCVVHEQGNQGLLDRCRGFGAAIRKSGGHSSVVTINLQNRHAAEQRISAEAISRHVDGMLTLGPAGAQPTIAGLELDHLLGSVHLATFDLSPEVLSALKRRQMEFAVDQQPFLQGYLPIVFLSEYHRYGLIPARGSLVPTGPSFVTRADADRVAQLIKQGIR
jgi:simple sugar transport system substrate-binding protein